MGDDYVKKEERCRKCIWKTMPGENIVVCSFPQCIYRTENKAKSPISRVFGDNRRENTTKKEE